MSTGRGCAKRDRPINYLACYLMTVPTNLHCAAEGCDVVVLDTGKVGALSADTD